MAITKIDTDMIANDAITADKIAAGALDTQLAGYLSTNSFATESYVGTAISNLVDSSPATLDTLNELAAALGDDPNFATTTATAIGLKAPLASPSFTGAATFSGNVGIAGQASPTYKLDGGFADQTWGWYLNSSYNAGFTFNTTERSLLIHTKSAENIDHIKFATSSTGTERMRIDSGGLLLLNETSSRGTNVVGKMQTQGIHTFTTINNEVAGFVGLNSNADNSLAIGADPDNLRAGSHIIFYMDGLNEKMRLDASGNLLVGTTDDAVWNNTTGNGINLRGDLGLIASARTNAESAMFNRMGTDGDVIKINKDGATVGSIGNSGTTAMYVGSGDTQLLFKADEDQMVPFSAGGYRDAAVSLGRTNSRFKDLYLSGNAKASNLQLLEGTTQTGGVFKEKDLLGAGTSTATSIFSETGSGIKFFVNGSVPAVATIYSTGAAGFTGDLGVSGALSVGSSIIAPSVYANYTGGSPNMYINPAGLMQRVGSSLRYKNTVNDATHGLAELLTLRPVTYKGNNDGDTIFGGLIAEEVHDAGLTEFVQYSEEGEPDGLGYGSMVSLCIKAIQEQQTIIQEQQALTAALTARIEALEGDL